MKLLILSLILSSIVSCGTEEKSKQNQPPVIAEEAPKSLSLASFKNKSFMETDLDKKCEALDQFIAEYHKKYLNGVTFKTTKKCSTFILGSQNNTHETNFTLTKNENSIDLNILIIDSGKKIKNELNHVTKDGDLISTSKFVYKNENSAIHENLKHFQKTLDNWTSYINIEKYEGIVQGLKLSEFVKRIQTEVVWEKPLLKVEYSAIAKLSYHTMGGKFKVLEIDSSYFTEGFLGCKNIECLQKGDLNYFFKANQLFLERTVKEENGVETTLIASYSFKVGT